jgi:hypothetical protein
MSRFELETFLMATDGIGFSDKREFYQTGYGFGFDHFFWIEVGIEPPVPPYIPPTSLGGGYATPYRPPEPLHPIKQVHYVKFYLKSPSGEIVTKRYEIKEVMYKFILNFITSKKFIPTFVIKQIEVVANIYHKIKVRLVC